MYVGLGSEEYGLGASIALPGPSYHPTTLLPTTPPAPTVKPLIFVAPMPVLKVPTVSVPAGPTLTVPPQTATPFTPSPATPTTAIPVTSIGPGAPTPVLKAGSASGPLMLTDGAGSAGASVDTVGGSNNGSSLLLVAAGFGLLLLMGHRKKKKHR